MEEDTNSNISNTELVNSILEFSKLQGNLLLGMIYGSQKKGNYLDIFLVYNNNVKKNIPVNNLNNLDISQIEINNFKKKIFYRDIEYTEPILTGKYLCGNKNILEKAKDFLINTDPDVSIYDYLGKRCIKAFLQAEEYYFLAQQELFIKMYSSNISLFKMKNYFFGNDFKLDSKILNIRIFTRLLYSLSLLNYSLSHLSARKRYIEGARTVTLQNILDNPLNSIEKKLVVLRNYFKLYNSLKLYNRKEKSISLDKINLYFKDVRLLLSKELW
jgi:hypothetical protein